MKGGGRRLVSLRFLLLVCQLSRHVVTPVGPTHLVVFRAVDPHSPSMEEVELVEVVEVVLGTTSDSI